MTIVIPKNATKAEVKKAIAEFEKKRMIKKNKSGNGNVLKHFGSNPAEVDGLEFQKKVRSEWD
jgi:hypothetical protein